MTSELWNDLNGFDRIQAILSAKKPKRTARKPRIERRTCESDAAFAWRKASIKNGPFFRMEEDDPYQLDPLPVLKAVNG